MTLPAPTQEPARRKATRTAWKPGQSGNPGGRPREVAEVRDLAREHTPKAIATLAGIMDDAEQPARARVAAAEALLDRGWGRATQPMEVTTPGSIPAAIQKMPSDELERWIRERSRMLNGTANR